MSVEIILHCVSVMRLVRTADLRAILSLIRGAGAEPLIAQAIIDALRVRKR